MHKIKQKEYTEFISHGWPGFPIKIKQGFSNKKK